MTIENMIKSTEKLTPIESQLAEYILNNKEEVKYITIKELSEKIFVSKSAVLRFCKKIGLDGFNELKVKLAEDLIDDIKEEIDVNFPFTESDTQGVIANKLVKLYETTILDTYKYIDFKVLNNCVAAIDNADIVDIYTHAHNLNVAENFQDKMRAIGRMVNCPKSLYEQRCTAITSKKNHIAIILSYSGKAYYLENIATLLSKSDVEIIFIGGAGNKFTFDNVKYNLFISDKENYRNRISQFSSHIAMQYMLDLIFSCIFKRNYHENMGYLETLNNLIDDRGIDEKE